MIDRKVRKRKKTYVECKSAKKKREKEKEKKKKRRDGNGWQKIRVEAGRNGEIKGFALYNRETVWPR